MAEATTFEWLGDEILIRQQRAMGRGIVGCGMSIAREGKGLAHVQTGTLRRSIHAAPFNYTGGNDYEEAAGGAPPADVTEATFNGGEAVLEVGSWVPYACVNEFRYGFMEPAVELVRGPRAVAMFVQAFAEEGLMAA